MKDIEKIIVIEDIELKIDTCFGDTQCLIEFAPVSAIAEFCANDRNGIDPWSMLLNFKNPIAALTAIGKECLALAQQVNAEHGVPVFFAGKDAKRQRVYLKMLQRAGITCSLQADEDGDIFIRVI